jgi:6-phosphogluconolactonase
MATSRRAALVQELANGCDRREVLRRAGMASVTFAALAAVGGSARVTVARQATPVGSPTAAGGAGGFAYVGSYTRGETDGGDTQTPLGISIFAVDAGTGALSFIETVPTDNPSWVALHPTETFLYAVNEIDDYEGEASGSVEAYAVDPTTGALTLLNEQSSEGLYPAHLTVDPSGAFAVVADYSGPFAVLPIAADGSLEPASDIVQNTGTGPNAERQEMSHPLAVVFDPAGQYLATADLGIDTVQMFRLDPAGQLEPLSEAALAPGAGPRHIAFFPDGRFLYVTNELDATVTAFAYDAASGTIGAEIQTVSTVPEDFADPKSTAEIAVHPSGKFLYVSNRGSEGAVSPVASSIAGFTIDEASGELTLIEHTSKGIDVPRHFTIDPSGTWLYACNQQGDSILQFAIDQTSGQLSATGQVIETPTPVCIVFTTA